MTLHKSMWKAAVLMGIAGVLMFAGGALAKEPNTSYKVTCSGLSAPYGSTIATTVTAAVLKEKCTVFGDITAGATRDTLWLAEARNTQGTVTRVAGPVASSSYEEDDSDDPGVVFDLSTAGNPTLVTWDASTSKMDSTTVKVTVTWAKMKKKTAANEIGDAGAPTGTTTGTGRAGVQSTKLGTGTSSAGLANAVWGLYNPAQFTAWLTASGRTFDVGTVLADLELPVLPLKAGMPESSAKNGRFYYRFVGQPTGATRTLDTLGVPALPGEYDIYLSFGKGDNHDSTNVKGQIADTDYKKLTDAGKKLTIDYVDQPDWGVTKTGDTTIVYQFSGTWTLKAPDVDAMLVGTADTVIYTSVEAGDAGFTATGESYVAANATAVVAAEVKPASNKGATFTLAVRPVAGTVIAGSYKIKVQIVGKDPAKKYTWKVTNYTFQVVILPKPLSSSDITIAVNGDNTAAYTYNKAAQSMSVTVRDGSRVLTQSDTATSGSYDAKDFAVNRKVVTASSLGNIDGLSDINRIDAGPASALIEGAGNYTGIVTKGFTILPKGITYALRTTTVSVGSPASDVVVQHKSNKIYDGTTRLGDSAFVGAGYDGSAGVGDASDAYEANRNPKGGVDVTFSTIETGDEFELNTDYTITSTLNNANKGTNRSASVVVALKTGSDKAKNYKLNTTSITVTGINVDIRDPNTADASYNDADSAFRETFKYTIPKHYFWGADNAARRGIGSVTYQTGMTNPGALPIKVLYEYPGTDFDDQPVAADFKGREADGTLTDGAFEGDTTRAPRLPGIYTVKVVVADSSSITPAIPGARTAQHIVADTFELGPYKILPPGEPTFAEGGNLPAKVEVRTSRTTTLKVTAVPFNYGTAAAPILGTLSYQWWRSNTSGPDDGVNPADAVKVGSNRATHDATVTDSVNSVYYWVEVFNGSQTYQQSALGKITSAACEVAPLPPPQTIAGRVVITKPDSVVYNGTNQTFTTEDSDVGPAELTVSFINVTVGDDGTTVRDTVPLTAQTTADDGSLTGDYRLVYSDNRNVGTASILVVGTDAYTGTESVTFKIVKRTLTALDLAFVDKRPYTGEALGANVRPVIENETGMGAITVTYNGQAAVPKEQGVYNLSVSVAAGSNYTAATNLSLGAYEIGMGVFDSTCISYETMRRLSTDPNLSKGIGAVSFLKGTGFGDSIIITYNGMRDVPSEVDEYEVYARILGGVNYEPGNVRIGTYKIVETDAVAESNREVPKTDVTEVVTVAPVKVVASGFTAGPSPVSKGGVIKFFSAKEVKNGSFYIFDASGNAVAKVTAKSGKKGEVGSWNLKDKKGVAVSEGTYVVKGVLVGKDGTKEKVSFPFSVTK